MMKPEKDLRYVWRVLLARKHYFIWPFLAIVLISGVVAMVLPPIYESRSTILIEEQQIPPEFVKTTVTGFADQRIQSLNQQILSRTKLLEIIRQFNLYPEMRDKYAQEEIIEKMRENIAVDLISAEVGGQKRKQRGAGGGGVTIAFTIAYRGKNPGVVQRVAGTLASLYLEENLKIREMQAKTTTKFLENELKEIKERIKSLGEQISEFKSKRGTILPELQQFNLAQVERLEKEIQQLEIHLRTLEDRKIYLEGQIAAIPPAMLPEGGSVKPLSPQARLKLLEVALCDLQSRYSKDHPDIAKAKREIAELEKLTGGKGGAGTLQQDKLAQLKAQLTEKQGRYAEEHPEIVKLKKEIAALEKLLQASAAGQTVVIPDNPAQITLMSNLQSTINDIKALKQHKLDLEAKLKTFRQRVEEGPKVEQDYLALIRDYQNAHTKHQEIMNKILEARIAEGMEESQKAEKFTIIDPASFPEKPVSPNRTLIFLAGFLLSLGAGVGMVALTENLDHSVKHADELAWLTGLPVLGTISRIVTTDDLARRKRWWRWFWLLVALSLVVGVAIFHFFFMDLWILAAKVSRLLKKIS